MVLCLVSEYFDLLVNCDYNQLMCKLNIDEESLKVFFYIIQFFNFRFGSQIIVSKFEYIILDVYVCKVNDSWKVEFNLEVLFKLCINFEYVRMVKQVKSSFDMIYMKNYLQEVCWFIKSLVSCNEILFKVVICIVEW